MFYAILIVGTWNMIMGLVTNANQNTLSQIIFKVIPFVSGLFLIWYAAKMLGWFAS